MKTVLLIIVMFLFSSNVLGQGAWTLQEGRWYTQLQFTNIGPYSELFVNGNDKITLPREVVDNTIQIYMEYGLNDKTTIQLNLPFKFINTGESSVNEPINASESIGSLGNIGFGVKRKLYDKQIVVSTSLAVDANTSTYYDTSGIRTGYDAWTLTPSISVGSGFDNFFLQGNVGFGIVTNNYSEYFKVTSEVGYKFLDKIWTILYLDYKASLSNGTIVLPDNNLSTSLYVNNQEYFGYGLKAILEFNTSIGITAGIGGAFSANQEAKKAALNVGFFYKFSTKKIE